MIQKQFALVFLAITSQYSLKCLVISLRLEVSSWDNGLVEHTLEACKFFFLTKRIFCEYFSTLYTNIPHDLLQNSIGELIRESYRIRGAKYLVIKNYSTTYWSYAASTKKKRPQRYRLKWTRQQPQKSLVCSPITS